METGIRTADPGESTSELDRPVVEAEGLARRYSRFVRDADRPRSAEAAVTVIDEWQGRGLGTLAQVLRTAASGVARFVADRTGGGAGEQSREGCE
ncbi:MAG TPA: hypothetical protein VHI76_03625 [Solirubrobacterales bacterium]|jgi:hypothetical protein|nr:hypothetical protein [Solirubrobacterales bacterium]